VGRIHPKFPLGREQELGLEERPGHCILDREPWNLKRRKSHRARESHLTKIPLFFYRDI
jgi:hypothetical protein